MILKLTPKIMPLVGQETLLRCDKEIYLIVDNQQQADGRQRYEYDYHWQEQTTFGHFVFPWQAAHQIDALTALVVITVIGNDQSQHADDEDDKTRGTAF